MCHFIILIYNGDFYLGTKKVKTNKNVQILSLIHFRNKQRDLMFHIFFSCKTI